MRCSECYEPNPAWQDLCSRCGRPTLALRLCPNGHLLAPKVTECAVCPSMWPQAGPFSGPPILRGALWADAGRLRLEDSDEAFAILELRDTEVPHAFRVEGSDCLRRMTRDPGGAALQVLVRPEGVFSCLGPEYRPARSRLEFTPVPGSGAIRVGPILVRIVHFAVPDWVLTEMQENVRSPEHS